jgi:beta-galactosidase beta subunit
MIISTLEHSARAEAIDPAFKKLFSYVKATDFGPDCDMALYSDTPSLFIDLLPGQFAIIYPEDPHAPIIGEGKIRKLIAKIKI